MHTVGRHANLAALCWLACACSSPPVPIPDDPADALDLIDAYLARDDGEAAVSIADHLDRERFTNEQLARLDSQRVKALYLSEEYWDAFRAARDFIDDHRFSDFAGDVEEFEFRIGKTLLRDDDDDGIPVLQHFVERFPASALAAEAWKLLGDHAFANEEFAMAELRFQELLQNHPSSEWAAFARYRLAMTAFRRVRGPEYDLDQMLLALNELTDYLALDPERPEFRREANSALATLETWIARRHVVIADFYRRVGNDRGEILHLRYAFDGFPGTPAGQEAARRLGDAGPASPPAGGDR